MITDDPKTLDFLRVDVVYPRPVEGYFSYLADAHDAKNLKPGCPVIVPVGKSVISAFVVEIFPASREEISRLKHILDIIDLTPLINSELLHLLKEVSHYYHSQLGWVIKTALPPGIMPEEIQQIGITEKGKIALESKINNHLSTEFNTILSLMDSRQKMFSFKELVSLMKPFKLTLSLIYAMENENLVQIKHSTQKKIVRSTPRFYRMNVSRQIALEQINKSKTSSPKKAKVLEQILEFSKDAIPFSARELNLRIPRGSSYLKKLLEEKFVVAADQIDKTAAIFENGQKKIPHKELMVQQKEALGKIGPSLGEIFQVFLLHGVTGSGKTEVYLHLAEKTLLAGHDVLILVPEIGLTPAFISRIKSRFFDKAAILHSGIDKKERVHQWLNIRSASPKIILGTRSAVFSPMNNPGLIIVDEEHDSSFKQANNPAYHARDVAILRGFYAKFPVVLGSATPSMESYHNAMSKKYRLISMESRVDHRPLPPVEINDMRKRKGKSHKSRIFSNELLHEIENSLEKNEQVLIFVPRRGFSNFILCHECGYIPYCDRCSVSLTYHATHASLNCHYCNRMFPMLRDCPECFSKELKGIGVGTQSAQSEMSDIFPQARISRLDTDTARSSNLTTTLRDFSRGQIDILIGTQMITKGHDFHKVTLVGVLGADSALHLPDFRAAERTFQMLAQVAGRTGRGTRGGESNYSDLYT